MTREPKEFTVLFQYKSGSLATVKVTAINKDEAQRRAKETLRGTKNKFIQFLNN